MKMKRLTLEHTSNPHGFHNDKAYRVLKAQDTVEFSPGDLLGKAEVESLCNLTGWSITILPIR